jgi:Na+:H+ antiporter, NhaA family
VTSSVSSRLDPPVTSDRDHCLGSPAATLTLLEFGSFNCPHCRAAHDVVANLRDRFGDQLRYVYRHRPITGSEPARYAAELAQYAQETTGNYWQAHDLLMKRGPDLQAPDFREIEAQLNLPSREQHEDAWRRAQSAVQADIDSANRSGVTFAPTFFINNRRYEGPWDESSLAEALLGSLGHRLQAAALDFARWAPSTGLLLLSMTILAIVVMNSTLGPGFEEFWRSSTGFNVAAARFQLSTREWVNDGLLTIFFLVVGLEIKREFTVGRLSNPRAAALPFAAAAGGMLLPALIYLAIVPAGRLSAGWAIPTTTDTAFAVALIAFMGHRVPVELRIFLTAAVVLDDLVAIAVVAIFYSGGIHLDYLIAAAIVVAMLVVLNRNGVYRALPYGLLGIALWVCLHHAGIHATLAGVIVAVVTPTRPPANLNALLVQSEAIVRTELGSQEDHVLRHRLSDPAVRALDVIHDRIESPAAKLLRSVEPWSSYLVLPLFALANAGIAWSEIEVAGHEKLIAAVLFGLVLGKPLGMVTFSVLAVRLGWATKPDAYSWRQLLGAGALAGIGFTMSLYIAAKAFADPRDFAAAKLAVFAASLLAGALGTLVLWSAATPHRKAE